MGLQPVIAGFLRPLDRPAEHPVAPSAHKLPRGAPRLALLVLLAITGLCHPVLAQITINVPKDQPTIQAGINAAQNGDTVLVAPGTYNENIDFNGKAITVTSSGGAVATIIDGGATPGLAVVAFENNEQRTSVLSNFTIRNGGSGTLTSHPGGGVYISQAAPTVLNNVITSNQCSGIYVDRGAALIQGNNISGTFFTGSSYCSGSVALVIAGNLAPGTTMYNSVIGNTIENNTGDTKAAISIGATNGTIIVGNIIRNNVSTEGAVQMVNSGSIIFSQNLVYGNYAGNGVAYDAAGGLTLEVPSDAGPYYGIIANNTFANNTVRSTAFNFPASQVLFSGDVSEYTFVNNIVYGTGSYPLLICNDSYAYLAPTPMLVENNDAFNSSGPAYDSSCANGAGVAGNISADPLFNNAANNDFHLQSSSPAIDTGNNQALAMLAPYGINLMTDIAGNPRVQDATGKGCVIDMGAYEYPGVACVASETLTSSLNPALVGQSVTFTAQLSSTSGTPTGDMQFFDGTILLSTQTVSNTGSASFTTSTLAVGSHTITAYYQPAGTFVASSATVIQVINGDSTSTTLISSINPSTFGLAVSFIATVTSAQGTPAGSIVFTDGSTTLGTVPLVGDTASFTISTLPAGKHTITATYSPTGTDAGSSASLIQTVNQVPTSTALTSSVNPAYALQPVTLTAAVTTAANGTPTGTVTFMDGATTLGTVPLSASGQATLSVSFASAGNHALQAVYSGDNNFNGSSASFTESVLINPTTTTLLATPLSPGAFTPVTLTATVAATLITQNLPGFPAGSVTFYDGVTPLGTAALNTTGTAALVVWLPAGTHSLAAAYAGNQSFEASASPVFKLLVARDATVTYLTGTPGPAALGTAVTFTATVTSPPTLVAPTGYVTFYDGTSVIGQVALDAQGHAVLTTSSLTVGTHAITASYSGDNNFTASVSSTFDEDITAFLGDFTLSVTPNTFALYTGQSGNATITATAQGGFHYDLSLTCAGLPAGAACEFSAPDIPGGNGQIGLTITTAAPQAAAAHSPSAPWRTGSLASLAFLLFVVVPRRRFRVFFAFMTLFCCLGSFTGCGDPGTLIPGTPPGTYTITLTALAGNSGQVLTHSTAINLTVKSLF